MDAEKSQKAHHEQIAAEYESHYFDKFSQIYRDQFIHKYLIEGLPVAGRRTLDALCGPGPATEYLLRRTGRVTGLDISLKFIQSYKGRYPEAGAVCSSIIEAPFKDSSFDCVFIVSGLHHLHPKIDQAIDEIYRILKPGGYFCFAEPHEGSLPDWFRKVWYRHDALFMQNEAAVAVDRLEAGNSHRFDFLSTRYYGDLAYLLVLNSLIFRIPLSLKRVYAPILIQFEKVLGPLHIKQLACAVLCQWRKKGQGER